MAFSISTPAAALTHEDDTKKEFQIRAGNMENALKRFSEQSGVSLTFDHRIISGRSVVGVEGNFTPKEALEKLVDEAGLTFRTVNDHSWVIVSAPPSSVVEPEPIAVPNSQDLARRRDEIIVTASYRAPSPKPGTRALYTLEGDELRLNGAQNVAEPIFELPSTVTSVSSANTALLLSSNGLNLADLRGLGPERTLVLVNGKRYIRTAGGNGSIYGVDLNTIPTAFVERIEIINQGAGAAIGLEAIAGAVNIVTRNRIDGLMMSADGGISGRGDAEEYSLAILGGKSFADDRGNITAGITFAAEPSLLLNDRSYLSSPYGFDENGNYLAGLGGSAIGPNSRISGIVTSDDIVRSLDDGQYVVSADGTSFDVFTASPDQLYNWTDGFNILPDIRRFIGYSSADYHLGSDHNISAEIHYADVDVDAQIAPVPLTAFSGRSRITGDATVVTTNMQSPAGLQAQIESDIGEAISGYVIDRRYVELGLRRRDIERESFQVNARIDGPLFADWRYDVSYQYGRNRTRDIEMGLVDVDRLALALDPDACALQTDCDPINLFAPAAITTAQADFISADPQRRTLRTDEQIVKAEIAGDIYSLGTDQAVVALGFEYRRDTLADEPDENVANGQAFGTFAFPGGSGTTSFRELYGNIGFPLIVDRPFAKSLEVGGAFRFVKRRNAHGFINLSVNTRWVPSDGIELYGHFFDGSRAPNIVELTSQSPSNFQFMFDPCSGNFTSENPVLQENCVLMGIPADFVQPEQLVETSVAANVNLREEDVQTFLLGASVDVDRFLAFIPGRLKLSADWRDHQVTDLITSASGSTILNACLESPGLSSQFCGINPATGDAFIQRDASTRTLQAVISANLNGGTLKTNGLDTRLNYYKEIYGLGPLEEFSLDLLYTYTHRVRQTLFPGFKEEQIEGLVPFPRHQIHATTGIGSEALKTVWTVRRRSETRSAYNIDNDAFRAPAITYVDASVQWRPENNIIVYGGVENLLDRDLPIVAGAPAGFYLEQFDAIGRRFFAGIRAEF